MATSTTCGQREIEYRALTRLALHPYFFAVRLHNSLGDGQPHTRSLSVEAMPPPAEKLVEYARTLILFDAGPVVGDSDYDFAALQLSRDIDR